MPERFKPNVTVASVICQDDRFLMVEELIDGQTRYNQPAGHLEAGEDLIAAATRETLEETAWEVKITGFLGVCVFEAPTGTTFIRHTFAGSPEIHHQGRPLDTGIVASHWLTLEEISALADNLRSPMIIPSIKQFLEGSVYPLAMVSWQR